MPRVHFVKKARKKNPAVKRGESYYWWKFRYGGKRYSVTRPRPSQLTQSAYYGTVRAMCETIEDTDVTDNDDLTSLRDDIASQLQELGSETQDSLSNMPDSLQYAPTGELLQERIDACENAESEVEGVEEFDEEEPQQTDFEGMAEECETCEGRGHVDPDDYMDHCADCNGDGEVKDDGENDYNEALSTWEDDQHTHISNAKDEIMEAVSNCEV